MREVADRHAVSHRTREPAQAVEDRAFVLKLIPYRERDRVVHLFTREHGKLGALARGARGSSKRFGGALQPFVPTTVELGLRTTSSLAELRAAYPVGPSPLDAADPVAIGRAAYVTELVEVLTRERDPQPEVFDLLLEALHHLGVAATDSGTLLRAFEVNLLDALGLWPDFSRCALCGTTWKPAQACVLRAEAQGPCCEACGEGETLTAEKRLVFVPTPLGSALERPLSHDLAVLVGREARRHIIELAPAPLRSVAYLKQLRAKIAETESDGGLTTEQGTT